MSVDVVDLSIVVQVMEVAMLLLDMLLLIIDTVRLFGMVVLVLVSVSVQFSASYDASDGGAVTPEAQGYVAATNNTCLPGTVSWTKLFIWQHHKLQKGIFLGVWRSTRESWTTWVRIHYVKQC